jgi:hypothetical protein
MIEKIKDIHVFENPNLPQILPHPLGKIGLSEMVNEFKQIYLFLVILILFDPTQNIEIRQPIIWPWYC